MVVLGKVWAIVSINEVSLHGHPSLHDPLSSLPSLSTTSKFIYNTQYLTEFVSVKIQYEE
jgi:hypothetical protein